LLAELDVVLEVWHDVRYTAELSGGGLVCLMWGARAGEHDCRGVDFLRFNDAGLIDELTVMVRPLPGLQVLAEEMAAKVSPNPDVPA
jgi:hypothetical protein